MQQVSVKHSSKLYKSVRMFYSLGRIKKEGVNTCSGKVNK